MATPRPPRFNPTAPIPNNPFVAPVENYIEGEYSPLIVGTGLSISPQGVISATGGGGGGGVTSVSGISPISVALGTTTPTISISSATTATAGVVILNSAFNSTSTTTAATSSAVKAAYDVASGALPRSGGTMTGVITFAAGQTFPASALPTATTLVKGIVQVGTNIQVSAAGVISVNSGSTTTTGVVQLVDNVITPSSSLALTANQGVILQNQISALGAAGGLTLAGTLDASTGDLITVSTSGASASFTVGSPLPTAVVGNTDYFVIVTTPGTFTPPGGASTSAIQGDWFLSNGSAWEYLAVGATVNAATTTSAGIVELATNAEVAAGTDTTRAVTPAGLASAYVACDDFSTKGDLLAGTGAGAYTALGVGTNGQALVANSAATSGLCWTTLTQCQGTVTSIVAAPTAFTGGTITTTGTINLATTGVTAGTYASPTITVDACGRLTSVATGSSAIPCSIITGAGALIVGVSANTPAALPVGVNGTILTADSTCPGGVKWGAAGGAGSVTSVTAGAGLTGGTITSSGTIALASLIPSPSGSYSYPNITVDACGRVTAATSGTTPVCTTAFTIKGQILVGTGASAFTALPVGANGQVLMADSACTTCGVKWGAMCPGTVTTVTASAPAVITGAATSTPNVCISPASTTACGAVQLFDGTNSTSTTLALTAAQGKNLQDQINGLAGAGGTTLAGTFNANLAQMVTVTAAGTAASFAVGNNLPAAAAGNTDYYVIVTTGGSYAPPGGSVAAASQGDWFLSSGTAWQYLNVGADPTAASTTTAGIVRLATPAETQTGTDATLAITPVGAKATYIACTALTAKGAILTATAASTPSSLTVGTNGQILTACAACASGLTWVSPTAAVNATPTVRGILYGCTTEADPGTGSGEVALGLDAMRARTTGLSNVAVGGEALCRLTTGCSNTVVGRLSGGAITTACNNVLVGDAISLNGNQPSKSVVVGSAADTNNFNSCCNVIVGYSAQNPGVGGPSIGKSVILGAGAMSRVDHTGECIVAIGPDVSLGGTNQSNALVIGYGLNYWMCGDGSLAVKFGGGIYDCANAVGTAGQFLTSTGSRLLWSDGQATPERFGTVMGTQYGDDTPYGFCGNIALGYRAMETDNNVRCLNTERNTAVGYAAGADLTGSSQDNTFLGYKAGWSLTGSSRNVAIGSGSMTSGSPASETVAIGWNAGCKVSGAQSVAIGSNAGTCLTNGIGNVFLGTLSGSGTCTGSLNVSIGCGNSPGTTGSCNVSIGNNVAIPVITGSCQLAIGYGLGCCWLTGCSDRSIQPSAGLRDCAGNLGTSGQVLLSNGSNAVCWGSVPIPSATPGFAGTPRGVVWGCTTSSNTSLGFNALTSVAVNGNFNVALGVNALSSITSGSRNTVVGNQAGSITTGCNNVIIGNEVPAALAAGSCQLAIGFDASNCWLTGDSGKHIRPGAGIRDCAGNLGTNGQVLTSTGSALQWRNLPGCAVIRGSSCSNTVPAGFAPATICFNTAINDTTGWYNGATGVFQPNIAGYYQISATARSYTSPTGESYVQLSCNSTAIASSGTFGQVNGSLSALVCMNGTTDTLRVQLLAQCSGCVVPQGGTSRFSAILVALA